MIFQYDLANQPFARSYLHNDKLYISIEWGIPALIAVLVFVGYCMYSGIQKGRMGICAAILSLAIFSFSSYPLHLPVFQVTFVFLLFACVVDRKNIWMACFSVLIGFLGFYWWKTNDYEACNKWVNARMMYQTGMYESAKKEYEALYPRLNDRASFMFEYGHCLHQLNMYEKSNQLLQQASALSCDPMILNIIGKNHQMIGAYYEAEKYFLRSANRLPGRIYPYYLLAKLYAEPSFDHPEKRKKMITLVLTKEPKMQSAAILEMREEVKKLLP